MASGGGGQSTNTVQNTNAYIPGWLENYTQSAVGRASDLSNQQYTPYTGQTVAGLDPAQQQAYNQIGAMQGMGMDAFQSGINADQTLANQTTPLSAGGIQANTNALQQGFMNQVYNPAQGLLGNYAAQGPTTAQGVGQNAQALMSPYAASVIAPALQAGQQQLALANQGIAQQANNVGAFGGSRQGVQQGVAEAQTALGTQQQIANMLNTGWGNALNAGNQIGLQAGQQGLTTNTLLANLLSGGYGANQTAGANIMQQNLNAGLNAAQQLPNTLAAQQAAYLGQTNALNQAGTLQQQYQQNILNSQQAAFAQQQAFPYQQLQTLLGAVSGIPYSTSNTGTFSQNTPFSSNPYGQAVGGAAALGGLAGGFGSLLNSGNTTPGTGTPGTSNSDGLANFFSNLFSSGNAAPGTGTNTSLAGNY